MRNLAYRLRVSAAALVAATTLVAAAPEAQTPADIYGPLFVAVQEGRVFGDGKTFVDAVPKRDPAAIMADYAREKPTTKDALRAFVVANFAVPGIDEAAPTDMATHLRTLWPALTRPPIDPPVGSSALALPAPYIVPGGRFREIYYWDSFFTMLGLRVDDQQPMIESMIDDFVSLIERYGHIPNGTRTYYLSRSQPPFFALMLDLSTNTDPAVAKRRLAALRREHDFWMKGTACVQKTGACDHVVRMPDGSILNRYYDARDTPRDESYAEDRATAAGRGRDAKIVQRDLRAAAESGWDFSSRWLTDPMKLTTIHTTDIVPVDLNSLLYAMEERIADGCAKAADKACATAFNRAAARRRAAIDKYLWVGTEGRYADWDRTTRRATPILSAATLYPLFVGIASPAQAKAVAATTRAKLLGEGGLRTTTLRTGQQWDEPNGWAPLQWIAIDGFARNGDDTLARDIAKRWLATVQRTYRETGKMLEKYDVEEQKAGGGGEYPTQDGFGWTNGVTSALLDRYPGLDLQ